jgi:hypothetical protein
LPALSSPDCQVIAGDVYTLTYAAGAAPMTFPIIVDSSYRAPITDLAPVMFVEGAARGAESAESNAANRLTVRFNQGENYASLVQRNNEWFTAISDTRNAYIIRGEERIANPMLYDSNYRSRYFVERNDVLIIPFRLYFVTVAGGLCAGAELWRGGDD